MFLLLLFFQFINSGSLSIGLLDISAKTIFGQIVWRFGLDLQQTVVGLFSSKIKFCLVDKQFDWFIFNSLYLSFFRLWLMKEQFVFLFRVHLYSSSGCRQSGSDIPTFLLPLSTSAHSLQSAQLSGKSKQTFLQVNFLKCHNVLV